MTNLRVSTIENAINSNLRNPYVNLYKGEGYWYFVYDDPVHNIYRTRSIYTYRLNDFPLEHWIEEGNDLAKEVESA